MVDRKVYDTPSPTAGRVVLTLGLDQLDFDDTTYMFRAALRTGPLKKSNQQHGQQQPIFVRRKPGSDKYQIVCGFRRATALKEIGANDVVAIDRNDLDDETAFRVSVLENVARKSYSDIDRANAISLAKKHGHTGVVIAEMMGLTRRQKDNIQSLLELPEAVQEAVDDEEQHFSTTHAIVLRQFRVVGEKSGGIVCGDRAG